MGVHYMCACACVCVFVSACVRAYACVFTAVLPLAASHHVPHPTSRP